MTDNGACDGEKLLFESYYGEDKTKFEKKFNEIMQDDGSSYTEFLELMHYVAGEEGNEKKYDSIPKLESFTEEFDKKCEEYNNRK